MPRITPEIVAELKDHADIAEIIGQYVPIKHRGNSWIGVCPFHDDHSPSMHVTPSMKIYKCFACQAGGDVFKFLMDHEKLDFTSAVELVAEKSGFLLPEESSDEKYSEQKEEKARLLDILEMAANYFSKNLNSSDESKKYLNERKLIAQTISDFKLGAAGDSWDGLLSKALNQKISRQDLLNAGLIVEKDQSKSYDKFRSRLMFPIFNLSGKVIGFGGRAYSSDAKPKYLNSPETPLYHKSDVLYGLHASRSYIAKSEVVLFVEGYFDFLQLWQNNIRNVVSVSGTALTTNHAKIISRYAKKAVLVFDGDLAGEKATIRSIETLLSEGLEVRVLTLPQGQDPDSLVRDKGPELFLNKVATSLDFMSFLCQHFKNLNPNPSPETKAEEIKNLKTILMLIKDNLVRSEYSRIAAQAFQVPEQLFGGIKTQKINRIVLPLSRENFPIENRLSELLLESPELLDYASHSLDLDLIRSTALAEILDYMLQIHEEQQSASQLLQNHRTDLSKLWDRLPPELRPIYMKLLPGPAKPNAFIEYIEILLKLETIRIDQLRKGLRSPKLKEILSEESLDDTYMKFSSTIKYIDSLKKDLTAGRNNPKDVLIFYLNKKNELKSLLKELSLETETL